jgi:hypothetical protein
MVEFNAGKQLLLAHLTEEDWCLNGWGKCSRNEASSPLHPSLWYYHQDSLQGTTHGRNDHSMSLASPFVGISIN